MAIVFSPDESRFYASGGENRNIWVGDVGPAAIVGSVNLNGPDRLLHVTSNPVGRFRGAFPGSMALSGGGRFLHVVDEAGFQLHVIDTSRVAVGTDEAGRIAEPGQLPRGHRPGEGRPLPLRHRARTRRRTLFVTHVGVFQYTHLLSENPTGDRNRDFPLCYPAVGYPDETEAAVRLKLKKADPRDLPPSQQDPEAIRCGCVDQDLDYTVPGLGSPNTPESSSVYVLDVSDPGRPAAAQVVKTGPLVGEVEDGVQACGGHHPSAAARCALQLSGGEEVAAATVGRPIRATASAPATPRAASPQSTGS